MTIECDRADAYRQRSRKNKRKSGMLVIDNGLRGRGGPKLGWSSLEDINDPEALWPKTINRVAAACKDKTADEIFRQIGEELGKMGVYSAFLIREAARDNLIVSNVTLASKGMALCPSKVLCGEKSPFLLSESEIISRVLSSGEVVLTTDPDKSLRRLFQVNDATADCLSFICAPLSYACGIFGVLAAAAPDMTGGKAYNVALLAHIASMSYYNNRMTIDMDGMREKAGCLDKGSGSTVSTPDKSLQDLVYALTVSMEKRDPYTFDHQIRVTRLAVAIAEEMGLEQYKINGLRVAASVHDIGKIVIPFEILNRPARLSEGEFALIKMHPQVAFDMLSPISFRWPVAEIVRQHHERADGSGYPCGLKSDQTLLEAKVLAVADVIEAMSSHRPYRAALGINAALDEVSNKLDVLYDAEATAACIRLLLIKNFSLEGGMPSAWQSANPFTSLIMTRR